MKIAYISQSYHPMVSGAAIVAQRLAEGIADRDHSVTVLTASDRGNAYIEEMNRLKIVHFQSLNNLFRVNTNFVLWSQKEIFKALNDFRPDVLHLHDPLNLGLSALRAAQQLRIPSVVTIHQLP